MKMFVIIGVLLAAGSVAAQAEDRRECIRNVYEVTRDMAAAKRVCDPKNRVTNPNEYGWGATADRDCTPKRVKGFGWKQKKDVLCECLPDCRPESE